MRYAPATTWLNRGILGTPKDTHVRDQLARGPHEPDSNTAARLRTVCDPAGRPSLR